MSAIPSPHQPSGIEAAVCADIARRQALGIAKYGTTVAENPLPLREWLQHAYEECLDQAVYLRKAIYEIENRNPDIVSEQQDADESHREVQRLRDIIRRASAVFAGDGKKMRLDAAMFYILSESVENK